MKITFNRALILISLIVAFGLVLQQCWQSKPESEKWLYFFQDAAQEYANEVLGPGRGTDVAVPEVLSGNTVTVVGAQVRFSPKKNPALVLAFSPAGTPDTGDQGVWRQLQDAWYVLDHPQTN